MSIHVKKLLIFIIYVELHHPLLTTQNVINKYMNILHSRFCKKTTNKKIDENFENRLVFFFFTWGSFIFN